MVTRIETLEGQYGTVPPPWVVFPNEHLYSMCWRMGGGEEFIMVWWPWWRSQALDEAARIEYFRQFPPEPRWLDWMLDAIWDLPLPEGDDEEELLDRTPYFLKAETLGFGSREAYEQDLQDPRP
ncbi:hypothetical protein K7W42_02660 [Deinococcus sp. HMF7604]|uniref:hypothetical protein n=1 Tax=Deinococcus betulae TaxID=2873312 RepID=UPI001CC8F6AB|nr:hypothetical protein [Deinococcus betulae]MBZ9749759.1 hypothetical protein [Deinococcus betulae]